MAFAPYGDEWRQRRQICTLHLLSPKMVQSYALVREQEVATMVAAICSRGSAAEIDMSPVLFAFSNDILCRIVTGKKFEGKKGLFSKLISENSVLLAKIYLGDYLPWLGWVDWLLGKKDPVLESILTPEVIKALLQVYLPVFFGVVGSPAREGSFGEKLSSVGDWKLEKGFLLARVAEANRVHDWNLPNVRPTTNSHWKAFELVGFLLANQNVKDAYQLDWNKGPILNAFEIYKYMEINYGSLDALTMESFVSHYPKEVWAQEGGDPCLPAPWSWVQCNSDPQPQIHQLQHEVTIELAVLLSNEITIIKLGYAILRRIPKKLRLFSREDDLPPPQPFQELSASFGGFGIETTHRYWLSEINDATENFAKKVGSGGYGIVYYGKLKNGKDIAVKVQTNDSCQGNRQFSSEFEFFSIIMSRFPSENLRLTHEQHTCIANLSNAVADDDFPEMMPIQKGICCQHKKNTIGTEQGASVTMGSHRTYDSAISKTLDRIFGGTSTSSSGQKPASAGRSNSRNANEGWKPSFTGKSLEGSCATEPDPLDMSEEAKAARWFRRAAQIKDISELSNIPDEDFPEIMPNEKGCQSICCKQKVTIGKEVHTIYDQNDDSDLRSQSCFSNNNLWLRITIFGGTITSITLIQLIATCTDVAFYGHWLVEVDLA
ncbi:hypothetical protein ZIOFF_040475 [Zingiber officinale]|uniref:Uncharacterized protein n=1 Tax=Zingiber officinale TaxID=94328 RepID=A0A8J5GHM5_ZINOF|nr:hypothetical protein ZIOFF_040475 [Zingiber officinale]